MDIPPALLTMLGVPKEVQSIIEVVKPVLSDPSCVKELFHDEGFVIFQMTVPEGSLKPEVLKMVDDVIERTKGVL